MVMDLMESKATERDYALERLIMLSDGVFAIAITLLALELRPPDHWDGSMDALIEEMARPFLGFIISFLVIGLYWVNHRRMFGRFRSADAGLTALSLLLLGLITLAPVATSLMAEGGPRSAGYTVYVTVLVGIATANALIWAYAAFVRPQLFREPPPLPAKLVVQAVLSIPPLAMVLGTLANTLGGPISYAAVVAGAALIVGVRLLRAWAARSGNRQWLP